MADDFAEIVSLNKAIENVNENRCRMSIEKELLAQETKAMKQLVENQLAFNEQTKQNIAKFNSFHERGKEIGEGISACRSTFARGNFDELQRFAKVQIEKQKLFHRMRQANVEKEIQKFTEDKISRNPCLQVVKQKEQQLAVLQKSLQKLRADKSALQKRIASEKQIDDLLLQQNVVEMIQQIVRYKKNMEPSNEKEAQLMESLQKSNQNDIRMTEEISSEPMQSVKKKTLRKSSETLVKNAEEIQRSSPLKQTNVKFDFDPINEIPEPIQDEAESLGSESPENLNFLNYQEVSSSKSEPIPKTDEAVDSPSEPNQEDIQMCEENFSDESEQSVKMSDASNATQVLGDVDLISNSTSLEVQAKSKPTEDNFRTDADSFTNLSSDLNISSRPEQHVSSSLNLKPTSRMNLSMELETPQLRDANVNQMTEEKMSKPKQIAKKTATSNVSNILDDEFEDLAWSFTDDAGNSKTKSKQTNPVVDNSKSPSLDLDFTSMTDDFQKATNFKSNDDFNISDMDNELDEFFK